MPTPKTNLQSYSPNKLDPSQTGTLFKILSREIERRYVLLTQVMLKVVGVDNVLGLTGVETEESKKEFAQHFTNKKYQPPANISLPLKPLSSIPLPILFTYPPFSQEERAGMSITKKLDHFTQWYQEVCESIFLSGGWFMPSVVEAYKRGLGRVYDSVLGSIPYSYPQNTPKDVLERQKQVFVERVLTQNSLPDTLPAMPTINTLTLNKWLVKDSYGKFMSKKMLHRSEVIQHYLKDVSVRESQKIAKEIITGVEKNYSPKTVANRIRKILDVSKVEALRIARTELVRAQADAQLEALAALGETEVVAQVEYHTATDMKVCPKCAKLGKKVYTLEEAKGIIPVHPNCRCAWAIVIPKVKPKPKAKKGKK